MSFITKEDLENASQDADSLATFTNGSENSTVITRLGKIFPTLAKLVKSIYDQTSVIFTGLGYVPPVTYAAGISLTSPLQTVFYNGAVYAPLNSALPFTTNGTFETAKFRVIQNSVSASDLSATGGSNLVTFKQLGATTVDRSLQAKGRDVNSVTDWGNTVSQNTTNAAVNDMKNKGGGVLLFPNQTAVGITPPDLGNTVTMEVNGPDAPGTIAGEAYGSLQMAGKIFRSQNDRLMTNKIFSTVHVEHRPKGSGQSGPNTADFGLSVAVLKQNFSDPGPRAGEINGINVFTRNGGTDSDMAGLLVNVANYGAGFNALLEGNTTQIVNNQVQRQINAQLGVVDTRTNKTYGLVLQSAVNTQDIGLLIQNAPSATDNTFEDFIVLARNNVTATRISGRGYIYMRDADPTKNSSTMRFSVIAGALNFHNNGDAQSIMNLSQSGQLTVAGNIGFGAIVLKSEAGTSASAGGVAKPATYAGFLTIQILGVTQRVPYYNA